MPGRPCVSVTAVTRRWWWWLRLRGRAIRLVSGGHLSLEKKLKKKLKRNFNQQVKSTQNSGGYENGLWFKNTTRAASAYRASLTNSVTQTLKPANCRVFPTILSTRLATVPPSLSPQSLDAVSPLAAQFTILFATAVIPLNHCFHLHDS